MFTNLPSARKTLHKHPDFFNSSARTGLNKRTYREKSWGHRPFWDYFFKKTAFSYSNTSKTGMPFGQHIDGEPPRNLNHAFLRQFENGFNKKIGMFMFKNQNDGATLPSNFPFAFSLPLPFLFPVSLRCFACNWKYLFLAFHSCQGCEKLCGQSSLYVDAQERHATASIRSLFVSFLCHFNKEKASRSRLQVFKACFLLKSDSRLCEAILSLHFP